MKKIVRAGGFADGKFSFSDGPCVVHVAARFWERFWEDTKQRCRRSRRNEVHGAAYLFDKKPDFDNRHWKEQREIQEYCEALGKAIRGKEKQGEKGM